MDANGSLPLDTVIQGDCLEVLPRFPDCSVDLVFADPPYNLQLRSELWRPNQTRVEGVDDEWDKFESFEAYDRFTHRWLSECRRVLKDTGTLWVIGTYHNIHRVGAVLQDLGFWILNEIAWIKVNPMPNFRGVRFTNAHETLIWAQKRRGSRYTFNHHAMKSANDGVQMRSDWILPLCTGKERIKINGTKAHATQKPEALLRRVLMSSTRPGDIVLDPFFGTGTTGAAAKRLGRRWIGIEQDSQYVEIARSRIAAVKPDLQAARELDARASRHSRRIPFSLLLETGLLQVGQVLYASGKREAEAEILPGGRIRSGELVGSIHAVARQLTAAPCNGWLFWRYKNENGDLVPIDQLRKKVAEGQ